MAQNLLYGVGIDGKKYGWRVADTAYPQAILSASGFTKLAANGTLPTDVILLPNNQVKGFFCRLYLRLQTGKSLTHFVAADKAASASSLLGKSVGGSKVVAVRFLG